MSKSQLYDRLTIGTVILTFLATAYMYVDLPEIIPIHFNFKGEVDGYGSKDWIFSLPAVSALITSIILFVNRWMLAKPLDYHRKSKPHYRKYTDEELRKELNNTGHMMSITVLFAALLIAYILYATISAALNSHDKVANLPLILLTTGVLMPSIIMLAKVVFKKESA